MGKNKLRQKDLPLTPHIHPIEENLNLKASTVEKLYNLLDENILKELNEAHDQTKINPPQVLFIQPYLSDRFDGSGFKPSKSPLEYYPQRPSFAGLLNGGELGQLIPPGNPWPAHPPILLPVLEDRLKETTLKPAFSTTKSPLEYKPQKPSFAGSLSGGQLGQLVPPGMPWPADPPIAPPMVEDRLQEATTRSPLEYNPLRPSFAGSLSGGQLGQLIPPGKPWPANPPIASPMLEDRLKETTLKPASSSTKSPLEYHPQWPSFAGSLSGGQLGQLVPPGKPWPADPPIAPPTVEDRLQETTTKPPSSTTKSPLEYHPQRPSFAGSLSGGELGQLIPTGKPWSADTPLSLPALEDGLQQTTLKPASSSTKSPLEYKPQIYLFAGVQMDQLVPPGNSPLLSTSPPILED